MSDFFGVGRLVPHPIHGPFDGLGLKNIDLSWKPRERGDTNPAWDEWFDKVKIQLKGRERMFPATVATWPVWLNCLCGIPETKREDVGKVEVHYQAVLESIMLTSMENAEKLEGANDGQKSLVAASELSKTEKNLVSIDTFADTPHSSVTYEVMADWLPRLSLDWPHGT